MPTFTFETIDEDGDEVQYVVQGKYEVCPRCEGVGKHDHPAFDNGITASEAAEDPDFIHDYMRGRYDVTCERCRGARVVCVPDEGLMTPEQVKAYRSWRQEREEAARESAAERRMERLMLGEY